MGGRLYGRTPSATLTFQDIDITVFELAGAPWVSSADLARALGCRSAQTVEGLYRRNKDGFSADMSMAVGLVDGQNRPTRLFSFSGCHLLAMIARTSRARAFRAWLVDLTERTAVVGPIVGSRIDTLTAARFQALGKQIAAEFSAIAEPGGGAPANGKEPRP